MLQSVDEKNNYSIHRENETKLSSHAPLHLSIHSRKKKKKKDLVTHCIESSSHFGQLKKKKTESNNNINNNINNDNINKINVYTSCISILASNRHS